MRRAVVGSLILFGCLCTQVFASGDDELAPAVEGTVQGLDEILSFPRTPTQSQTEPLSKRNKSKPILFLIHFSSRYLNAERDREIIRAAQSAAESFRTQGGQIAVMDTAFHGDGFNRKFALINIPADFHYYSEVGRYDDNLVSSRIAVTGGFVGMCQTRTEISLVKSYFKRRFSNWFQLPTDRLTIDVPMALTFLPVDHERPWLSHTLHPTKLNYYEWKLPKDGKADEWKRQFAAAEADDFLSSLEKLEFESRGDFTVQVAIDGESLVTVGSGVKKIRINLWTNSKRMIEDQFEN